MSHGHQSIILVILAPCVKVPCICQSPPPYPTCPSSDCLHLPQARSSIVSVVDARRASPTCGMGIGDGIGLGHFAGARIERVDLKGKAPEAHAASPDSRACTAANCTPMPSPQKVAAPSPATSVLAPNASSLRGLWSAAPPLLTPLGATTRSVARSRGISAATASSCGSGTPVASCRSRS